MIGDNIGYRNEIRLPAAGSGGPYFASGEGAVVLTVAGVDVPLTRVRVGGVLPSGGGAVTSGLLRGFLPHETAKVISFPTSTPFVGGRTLASLLPGGQGACGTQGGLSKVDGVEGWWFYLNFDAAALGLTDL